MDEVTTQKVASIERCLIRVQEEYQLAGDHFDTNFTHQDAAILNLQRACEQSIDLANHLIRLKRWGIPISSGEAFDILVNYKIIPEPLGHSLKKMVGFRSVVVHEYSKTSLSVVKHIIEHQLDDFRTFCRMMLQQKL
jgi:uncharacterized protein YutE (UPF0331/DUF86 family)